MGKLKKGYNEKSRTQKQVDPEIKKRNDKLKSIIETDKEVYDQNGESNDLVIPSKSEIKKKTDHSIKKDKPRLTKKQKKNLQRIIDKKKKRDKREDILKSLSEHQVTSNEMALYSSTARMGQQDLKRTYEADPLNEEISSTKRRRRKKIKRIKPTENETTIVGGMQQDDSSSESEQSEEEIVEDENSNKESAVEQMNNKDGEVADDNSNVIETNPTKGSSPTKGTSPTKGSSPTKGTSTSKGTCPAESSSKISDESISIPEEESKSTTTKEKIESKPRENITPIYVSVNRTSEVQAARLLLPILPEEQSVMETISEIDVVVICGSTGSGKTTQIPQFLYEAGYATHSSRQGMIGITEPRRVAAVSMSKRVAHEMNMPTSQVSYQIRYEGNVTDNTKLKFMTDGVLLKEMENDFLLTKYSALIIDEAHERSVFTDILIGLLSRVTPLRRKQNNPLKLIIMSATLRVQDFTMNTRLFAQPPPVLKIDARQYPVTIHFNKRTHEDYVTEAFKKISKIHRTLKADGGILVFLTGQNEVLALCRKLKRAFPTNSKESKRKIQHHRVKNKTYENESTSKESNLPKVDLDSYSTGETAASASYDIDDDDDMLDELNSEDEEDSQHDMDDSAYTSAADNELPLYVLPLYSVLSSDKQAKVFMKPPEGCRLCVVATNVAETSLTIPGIKYIVDSGKVKKKFYDKVTGVSTFRIVWTSKASANQRAGRAGRVEPGHCYRLYSSAVFQNDFDEFSEPEICRRPVEDLVLQMKNMCIDKVINFPFPSPPDLKALQVAEKLLSDLGALKQHKTKKGEVLHVVSTLGKSLSKIPVNPRFAKMIWLSCKEEGCLQYVIAIVAALTVKEIFSDDIDLSDVPETEKDDAAKRRQLITVARRRWAGEGPSSLLGDLMVILRAVGACEYSGYTEQFCKNNGFRYKAMIEIKKLRVQLTNAVNSFHGYKDMLQSMKPPTEQQAKSIRQIFLSCYADHVARKYSPDEAKSLKLKNAYQSCSSDEPVFIHPTSSLFTKLPQYLVYNEIMETSKLYMKGVIAVEGDWLAVHASYMCTFGKPLEEPIPEYELQDDSIKCFRASTFGPHVWALPAQLISYPMGTQYYRWFAKYLLQGDVIEGLQKYSSNLMTPASVMVKSWSHLNAKAEALLACLLNDDVHSRDKLIKKWKENPKYLLKQYLIWMPESLHSDVTMAWPPTG